ncbi:type I restriction-modification system subunit M N-terminal domain-containing protein [Nitrincola tapanii]|uniref:type I restriction-modification system subunit M N-terminal domain-containing protein n=1 Tax=Nitrincola tapanii TaxID=1708751 RepID=UPI001F2544F5|nr:type I restriction-modification system subunit M N-terminal domain-containing protein [Nitrincola tapanii]
MHHSAHNKFISFIWSIADDCLRGVYVRGKYRDVILPIVVLRHLDTLLEPTKEDVLDEVTFQKESMNSTELDEEPLKQASGYVFYNTSKWTLKTLLSTATNSVSSAGIPVGAQVASPVLIRIQPGAVEHGFSAGATGLRTQTQWLGPHLPLWPAGHR